MPVKEVKKAIRDAADDSVARIMLICITAAKDEFDLDEEGTVHFMQTMQRYVGYFNDGTLDANDYSKSLKKSTGIDLKLRRW